MGYVLVWWSERSSLNIAVKANRSCGVAIRFSTSKTFGDSDIISTFAVTLEKDD